MAPSPVQGTSANILSNINFYPFYSKVGKNYPLWFKTRIPYELIL